MKCCRRFGRRRSQKPERKRMRALNGVFPLVAGHKGSGGSICRSDSGHCGERKLTAEEKVARRAQARHSERVGAVEADRRRRRAQLEAEERERARREQEERERVRRVQRFDRF